MLIKKRTVLILVVLISSLIIYKLASHKRVDLRNFPYQIYYAGEDLYKFDPESNSWDKLVKFDDAKILKPMDIAIGSQEFVYFSYMNDGFVLRNIKTGKIEWSVSSDSPRLFTISPDGRFIGYTSVGLHNKYCLVKDKKEESFIVMPDEIGWDSSYFSWSQDSNRLVISNNNKIYLYNVSENKLVVLIEGSNDGTYVCEAQFLSDSKLTYELINGARVEYIEFDISSGQKKVLCDVKPGKIPNHAILSKDCKYLVGLGDSLFVAYGSVLLYDIAEKDYIRLPKIRQNNIGGAVLLLEK